MSLFTALHRFAHDFRARRLEARTRNHIQGLPREIQKDIGWPDVWHRARDASRQRDG